MEMESWLSSQQSRGRDSHDIRRYIRVHGRVLSQKNSTTMAEDRDSDDFIMTSQQTRPRPTKQLTLMDLKRKQQPSPTNNSDPKEERTQKKENDQSKTYAQRFFLPALKFSTGVRRKATKEEANKENIESQEAESPKKTQTAVVGSPLRGVSHRSPCSVDKKPKRDKYSHSLSQLPTHKQGKRKSSEQQKKNEVVMESSDHFLSSRKRRAKDKELLDSEASLEVKRAAAGMSMKLQECGDMLKDDQASRNEEKSGTLESSDSDVYINTDELLAELSNCEKNLLNTSNCN